MSTGQSLSVRVAESWEEFDRLIEEAAVVVEFESESAERAYEDADLRLHLRICEAMGIANSPTRSDGLVTIAEDWFPTQTKFIEADTSAFTPEHLNALRLLLDGEFADWRINVQIYHGLNNSMPEHVGGVNIYRTRTLVQREALPYVQRAA